MAEEILQNSTLSAGLGIDQAVAENNKNALVNLMGVYPNVSYNLISLQPYMLTYAYKTYGFVQSAIDAPIQDAFRGGVKLYSETLSEDELDELHEAMENDWEEIKRVIRWGRLFGGGVLVANTDQKLDRPLSEAGLYQKRLSFVSSDRWECVCENPELTPEKSDFLYHGTKVQNSRTCSFLGMQAPYYIRMRLQGWEMSILESCLPPLVQYLKAQNVMLELLDESKIDILHIKDLALACQSPDGADQIRRFADLVANCKNFKSMITLDEGSSYEQKQINFGGLPELNKEIRLAICAYLGMPEVKVWGQGEGGFSNGEDKLELYNAKVESEIRTPAERLIKWVADLRCLQLFGRRVPDLKLDWENLRVMPEAEEQQIKTSKLDNALKLYDRGIIMKSELMQILHDENIVMNATKADKQKEYANADAGVEDEETQADNIEEEV